MKLSRTLLKNDDTLMKLRRIWRFLTGAGVLDHILNVLKLLRTILKYGDTLLEFRRTWRFLTGAGVLYHILDVIL